jgi:hypothetical protein
MSDRNDFLHPDYEPGEFDRVERQLRTALASEAQQMRPSNRLDAILHEAHAAGSLTERGGSGARRWLLPLASAAAVAAIIGGVWWSGQDDGREPTQPATTGPSVVPSTPATDSPGTATGSPTSSSTSVVPQTQAVSLPVYFVGPVGDDKPTYKLFRDFIRDDLPKDPTPEARAKAALVLAINAQPYTNTDGYIQPWSGQTIGDVTVTPQLITIDLANAGNPLAAEDTEVRRLAVQELVWTAQAAVQQGNIPVKITVNGKAAPLFGSVSTDQTFTRPPADRLYEDLAPIWVTSPTRDQVLPAGKPVTVKGLAIVFEANVSWQLRRGGDQIADGHTTASIGAPMQGEYSIALGTLSRGDYSIRVYEMSMEGGNKVVGEKVVFFSVK